MAFARAKFGLEYNPHPLPEGDNFPWLAVLAAVALLSTASLVARRTLHRSDPEPPPPPQVAAASAPASAPEPVAATSSLPNLEKRPPMVRNLLAKLEGAEATRGIEMAIDTIERLRALPGSPAADLDDSLARRLGTLNLRKLFRLKSREWVKEVAVRHGDNIERISRENGATAASTRKLNQLENDKLSIGNKLLVMNHPRFNLVIHAGGRYADLFFMGKFFKRYYLAGDVEASESDYRLQNIPLKTADREELKMLLPPAATVLVSEF